MTVWISGAEAVERIGGLLDIYIIYIYYFFILLIYKYISPFKSMSYILIY